MKEINPKFIDSLKTLDELLLDNRFTAQLQAPIDKELLTYKLSVVHETLQLEDEGGSGSSQGGATHKDYTDFLLPLPEELIPAESGMPHPDAVNASQAARGLNTKMDSNHRKALENKYAQKLKNRLAAKQKAKPRLGLMPTPFGTVKREEE